MRRLLFVKLVKQIVIKRTLFCGSEPRFHGIEQALFKVIESSFFKLLLLLIKVFRKGALFLGSELNMASCEATLLNRNVN